MMGKNSSKHECFLVNAHLNKAWEDQIWKKTTKTGYNLANYSVNQSMSELSVCLEDKQDNSDFMENKKENNLALKVELPPMKNDNGNGKLFTFDQIEEKEKGEKELQTRINIEEFECGVHFGAGENSKQEWSFTLYDFDGHGKITKEDLVGLLKALYDAIGSSIKIPNNGTKTLKVRLSVGQETSTDAEASQVTTVATAQLDKNNDKKDKKTTPKKKDNSNPVGNFKQKDSPRSKVKDISRLNNLVGVGSRATQAKCNNNDVQAQSKCESKCKVTPQRHKELASLVQENMERNQVKPDRCPLTDCNGCIQKQKPHRRRQRGGATTNSAKDNNAKHAHSKSATNPKVVNTDDTPKESQDRRNYYLDLAGVENNTSKFQDTPTTALATGKDTQLNNSQLNTSKYEPLKSVSALKRHPCSARHFRSRSHELAEKKSDNIESKVEKCATGTEQSTKPEHFRSKSFDAQDSSKNNIKLLKGNPHFLPSPQKQSRFRPVSLPPHVPETVSAHYHRRHRNREKDHDMAMQQVAEWIEREHTVDFEGQNVIVQRHEHHHVHEHHHHHHYHHYYEA